MEDKIRKAFFDGLEGTPSTHDLTFVVGGKTYRTRCRFTEDGVENGGCIEIDSDFDSAIKTNSDAKQCFDPMLHLKDNLPEGVKQTDILQVLSTKLKLILSPPCATLIDMARIGPIRTPISHWRLLRGEPALYEKYGYTSDTVNEMKAVLKMLTWKDIKDSVFKTPTGTDETLESIVGDMGLTLEDDKTISESMQSISYADVDKYTTHIQNKYDGETETVNIVGLILSAIETLYAKSISTPKFTVCADSDVWKAWDAVVEFVSFEPAIVGGRRKRQSKRTRRGRLHRKKLKHSRTLKAACVAKH